MMGTSPSNFDGALDGWMMICHIFNIFNPHGTILAMGVALWKQYDMTNGLSHYNSLSNFKNGKQMKNMD